jgi:hypothetical protein
MLKGILFWVLQAVSVAGLFGQTGVTSNPFEHSMEIFDPNGRTFVNTFIDAAGTPFFTSEWKYSRIVMSNNKEFRRIRSRLNLQTQEVHYLAPENVEMFIPAGTVKEITFFSDSTANARMLTDFQCGFPPVDAQNASNFYQVISRGKVLLLLYTQKSIAQEKDEFSGEIKKRFVEFTTYYVFAQNNLEKLKKDKPFLLSLLADKKDQVAAFIDGNKLKFKSADDIKKTIDYYNALP